MRTYLTFRQAYGFYQVFQRVELQGGEVQAFGYRIHHTLVFRRPRLRVFLQVLVLIPLELLDQPTRNQLHIAFRRRKIDERATVNQRRASDTHVHLFGSIVE